MPAHLSCKWKNDEENKKWLQDQLKTWGEKTYFEKKWRSRNKKTEEEKQESRGVNDRALESKIRFKIQEHFIISKPEKLRVALRQNIFDSTKLQS